MVLQTHLISPTLRQRAQNKRVRQDVRPKMSMTRLSLWRWRRVGSFSCFKVQGSRAAGELAAKGSTGNLGLNAW